MGQAPTKKVALVVGWNGAGKTACIQRIRGQSSEPLPTTGVIRGSALLKVEPPGGEEIECELDFIDVGSQPKLEAKSASYQPWLDSADCVIFVLDATRTMQRFRPEEVKQAKALIEVISREPEVRDKPFLVLINKSDREDSIPIQEAMELFELERLFKGKPCQFQACSAVTGEGLKPGYKWLVSRLLEESRPAAPGAHSSIVR
ncbi:unnamed protein product [Polarella glacialis]|uniref:Signal recognition particle receptor subunit beta n=1 Tax=Polarella glacialis TaxID=89957 RepID=A0A813K5T1_POLGL|nr:unnamed protein product [Polarella glacialis]